MLSTLTTTTNATEMKMVLFQCAIILSERNCGQARRNATNSFATRQWTQFNFCRLRNSGSHDFASIAKLSNFPVRPLEFIGFAIIQRGGFLVAIWPSAQLISDLFLLFLKSSFEAVDKWKDKIELSGELELSEFIEKSQLKTNTTQAKTCSLKLMFQSLISPSQLNKSALLAHAWRVGTQSYSHVRTHSKLINSTVDKFLESRFIIKAASPKNKKKRESSTTTEEEKNRSKVAQLKL